MTGDAILLNDFKAQWAALRTDYLEAIERVGRSGWLVLGREVETFETALAAYWGLPHAVGLANGLDALEVAFRCLGMKPNDLVVTTPLSAFATTLAIVRVGAIPVFADVDDSGLMDLEHAGQVIERLDHRPRFVVPVHLYGHAMNLGALESFAARHQLEVVEDCAQAVGARSHGRPVGAVSRACATSFYPTKNLGAFGDAGALLCKEESIRLLARTLRDYGQTAKYVHDEVGLNSRLDELQASLLHSVQLRMLPAWTARRRAIAARYLSELSNPHLSVPPAPIGSDSVWHLFPTLVQGSREAFRAHLSSRGIATGLHYPVLIHRQKALEHVPLQTPLPMPRAEVFATSEVSLPMHPYLSDDDVSRVITACNDWRP